MNETEWVEIETEDRGVIYFPPIEEVDLLKRISDRLDKFDTKFLEIETALHCIMLKLSKD